MRWYLFWGGGLLVAMVIVMVLAAGLYPKHQACEDFHGLTGYPNTAPEESLTPVTPDWHINADCQGVQNDLYTTYYFLAIGAALIGIGFLLR